MSCRMTLTPWWCLFTLVTLGAAAVVPTTQDTLVVARVDESTTLATDNGTPETSVDVSTEGPLTPLKMTEMDVTSQIAMRYAHTAVTTKVRNPARKAQEATFRVLLPNTAFISGFTMILDGKPYKAYVKEKEEAKKIFTDAVAQGVGAAHIAAKARDSNHFTVSVNVEPNTTAVFNLTYEELLVRRNGVYNHDVNLHPGTVVPRLSVTIHILETQKINKLRVPEVRTGNEIDANENDKQNSKAVIERTHDDREAIIKFTPDLEEQKRLMKIYREKEKESASQDNDDDKEKGREGVLGQFVVQYDVERPADGEILVNDGYFVHFLAPPDVPPLNKHVVFVLDNSGSMSGRKIAQLRDAMQAILDELNQGDYFNIVEFASTVKVHDLKEADEPAESRPSFYYDSFDKFDKPVALVPPAQATADNIAKAKILIKRLNASGGTNIDSALNVSVDLINRGVEWKQSLQNDSVSIQATTEVASTSAPKVEDVMHLEPVIIFLTDGEPTIGETDTKRIINRLTEKNYGENKATVYSLAFGDDADRNFLRKLSLRNEGFMRHIYEAADAALQLRDFYRQVSSPLLSHVKFTYPPKQVKDATKSWFRSLNLGSEAVVAGELEPDAVELAPTVLAFCGDNSPSGKKKYELSPKIPIAKATRSLFPLERLWAYLTVKQLLDERDAEEHADKPSGTDAGPEKRALKLALKYSFVTPLTSLVVVKPNDTRAVDAESVDKNDEVGHAMQFSLMSAPQSALSNRFSAPYSGSGMASPPMQSFAFAQSIDLLNFKLDDSLPDTEMEEDTQYFDESFPSTPSQQLPTTPAPLSTSAATVASLDTYHLQNYPWLSSFFESTKGVVTLPVNGTDITLKLAQNEQDIPTTVSPCPSAIDGAAGNCVYLSRCVAAQSITPSDYEKSFCSVNGYAGICCPKEEAAKVIA